MWTDYAAPETVDDALALLAARAPAARLVAGGTDLLIELELGVRPSCALIDLSRIPGLNTIAVTNGMVVLGPTVTHADVVGDVRLRAVAAPLAEACREVGAPQIRNRGTIAGNLVTASPANDTITALMALDASVTLRSVRGQRTLPLREFYQGVRKTVLQPDEMLISVTFAALRPGERGAWAKLGLRRAQAISIVNAAATCVIDAGGRIKGARIALGAIAPTILRVPEAEAALLGRPLDEAAIADAARLAQAIARPISDVRAGAEYRRDMVGVLVSRVLRQIQSGAAAEVAAPALLQLPRAEVPKPPEPGVTLINGAWVDLRAATQKSLLRALREDAGLMGTKEGCSEGECGACTVVLDGRAVMSCLVPAERARGADVVTVEGVAALAGGGALHPLQQAFIDTGAVQCGYCTPGLIMSGAALLAAEPAPAQAQVREAISGNLCRCTGYAKILDAFDRAARAGRLA